MNPRNCFELLEECRAAGLGVYPGPGEDDLCIIGDEEVAARFRPALIANKAAILDRFERQAIARCKMEEWGDIESGKRFCRRDCPHLKPWRFDWPGPGSSALWCCRAGARLYMLDACPVCESTNRIHQTHARTTERTPWRHGIGRE